MVDRRAAFVCDSASSSWLKVRGSIPFAAPTLISRARALCSSDSVPSLATRMCSSIRATARSKSSTLACRPDCYSVAAFADDVCVAIPVRRIASTIASTIVMERFTLCLLSPVTVPIVLFGPFG